MVATKVVCPFCSKRLKTKKPIGQGHRLLCSRCDRSFLIGPETIAAPTPPPAAPAAPTPVPPLPALVAVEVPLVPPSPPPLALAAVEVPAEPPRPTPLPPPLPPMTEVRVPEAPAALPPALPARSSRGPLLVAAACLVMLLAAGGTVALCIRLAERKEDADPTRQQAAVQPQEMPAPQPAPAAKPEAPPDAPVPPADPAIDLPLRPVEKPAPPPLPSPPPPEPRMELPRPEPRPLPNPAPPNQVALLPPDEQEKVNKAIDRGVEYLKKTQENSGSWPGSRNHAVGMAALPGLTLLECGVPPGDEQVQKVARVVRWAVRDMEQTYELALSILFLDRLGDPTDRPLIQIMAMRLVVGQTDAGGWTYKCPILPSAQEQNLLTVMRHQQRPRLEGDLAGKRPALGGELAGKGQTGPSGTVAGQGPGDPGKSIQGNTTASSSPVPGSTIPLPAAESRPPAVQQEPRPDAATAKKALDSLPAPLRRIPALREPPAFARAPRFDTSDNSNTQFAILGVWVAGRHGVPTEKTLAHIARRFRLSQAPDGGWNYPYSVPGNNSTPSMTGAGLLGLAVGLGLAVPEDAGRERKEAPPKDPGVEKGLRALGEIIGRPLGEKKPVRGPRGRWVGWGRPEVNLYFLWTLERVGVLYNLRHIAGKDWYHWGAEVLVDAQQGDGSWTNGGYPGSQPDIDTCFALLFLKRANFVQDLSRRLEFVIDVRSLSTGSVPPPGR
jgi:hypothetical protein